MELKPGYKQTDVGVIPEEWDVRACADVCLKIQDGTHFSPSPGGNDYLYITSKHIGFGVLDVSNADRIDAAQHKAIYQRCDVKNGDLLLTKDGANTGNAALNNLEEEFSLLSSVAFLRFDAKKHLPGYFLQQVLSTHGQRRIKDAMAGNAITRLTLQKIRSLRFPIASFREQCAIAGALGDVDALLGVLGKLIAKKRDLKQAAMQQLLTGQTRLPGFSGEWEVKRLEELFEFLNTANNPRADLSEYGDMGYIHYGDIHTTASAFLDCSDASLPLIARTKVSNIPQVEDGDLVMADASEDYNGIGKCLEIRNTKGRAIVAGLHTFLLRGDRNVVADGFKGYLQFIPSVRAALVRLATGISVYGVSKTSVKSIEVPLPVVKEQAAIAAVLSDMDAEIAALERRLAKTRALKQGMMQELLTGKTRLI